MAIQARQSYFELGDNTGKLLARYIKQRESFSTIPSVKSAGGEIFTSAIAIKNAFKGFYLDLYSSTSSSTDEDISNFVEPLKLLKLTTEQNNSLDSEINLEEQELGKVIKELPRGNALGADGLATEFFRSYATELAPHLLCFYGIIKDWKASANHDTRPKIQASVGVIVQFP